MKRAIFWRGSESKLEIFLNKDNSLASEQEMKSNDGKWIFLLDIKELANEDGARLCLWVSEQFSFFKDDKEPLVKLPNKYLKGSSFDTFYAGSFNPWHQGHQACIELSSKKSVLIIPDKNPWKDYDEKLCPWKIYQDLCSRFVKTEHSIYPGFLALEGKNPTFSWIQKTTVDRPFFLMGDDAFLSLLKWQKPDIILNHLGGLYVCPRGGEEKLLREQKEILLTKFPHLEITFLSHHPWEEVSSTNLR